MLSKRTDGRGIQVQATSTGRHIIDDYRQRTIISDCAVVSNQSAGVHAAFIIEGRQDQGSTRSRAFRLLAIGDSGSFMLLPTSPPNLNPFPSAAPPTPPHPIPSFFPVFPPLLTFSPSPSTPT